MVIRTMESKEEGSKDISYMVFTLHPFHSSFPSDQQPTRGADAKAIPRRLVYVYVYVYDNNITFDHFIVSKSYQE